MPFSGFIKYVLIFSDIGLSFLAQDLRRTFVIASAAKQSRNAATGKTGLPRLLRRLAMTMCVSPIVISYNVLDVFFYGPLPLVGAFETCQ